MFRLSFNLISARLFILLIFSLVANFTWAQSETATVSGQVVDPSGLSVTGARVKLLDMEYAGKAESLELVVVTSAIPNHENQAQVLIDFRRFNSGDVKGTIPDAVRYHFVPNDVRRHRLISISYISLLPCHGRGRGFESRRPRQFFQALAGNWQLASWSNLVQLGECFSLVVCENISAPDVAGEVNV
jgi:hypothetical protein